jgi:hypothetical protein
MIINKPFWLKETQHTKQAFSYDNASNVTKFVKNYGGKGLANLELSDEVAQHLPPGSDVYSVLVNSNPSRQKVAQTNLVKQYKILVKFDDGEYGFYDEGHASLREANTTAKSINANFPVVLVIREGSADEPVEEGLGVFA